MNTLQKKKLLFGGIILCLSVFLLLIILPLGNLASAQSAPAGPSACSASWYNDIETKAGNRGFFTGVSKECWACGCCGLCDFLGLANQIAKYLLSIIGALAFLMFIYGGISFIIASGSSEKIESAKKILINAVIGIAIVLLAWEIVNVVIGLVSGQPLGEAANIFGANKWYEVCKDVKGLTCQ